jgi:hypothetical protein
MINNKEQIKGLLNFSEAGDFYMLYVMKRKKDQPEGERDNHQSVRVIRSYCIKSVEQLDKRWEEIVMMCEMFKARAYIHVQKQNHRDVSLNMMVALAQRIQDGNHEQQSLFDSVVGQIKTYEKRWVVDVDISDFHAVAEVVKYIQWMLRETEPTDAVQAIIPTKSGWHLITSRFNVMEFNKKFPNFDIQKKNPTLLYYPNSLDNEN